MRMIISFWLFYRKLLVPTAVLSMIPGLISTLTTADFLKAMGFAFLPFALLMHFFIYEIRFTKEYYFYYNMGLGKISLWVVNLLFSGLISGILLCV